MSSYRNTRTVIAGLLRTSGVIRQVDIALPGNLAYRLPFGLVLRSGGNDDGVSDFATIDVEVYVPQQIAGDVLSEEIRQYLTGGGRRPPYPLDRVETIGAITELPYAGRGVRRWSNTYRVATRRTSAS